MKHLATRNSQSGLGEQAAHTAWQGCAGLEGKVWAGKTHEGTRRHACFTSVHPRFGLFIYIRICLCSVRAKIVFLFSVSYLFSVHFYFYACHLPSPFPSASNPPTRRHHHHQRLRLTQYPSTLKECSFYPKFSLHKIEKPLTSAGA